MKKMRQGTGSSGALKAAQAAANAAREETNGTDNAGAQRKRGSTQQGRAAGNGNKCVQASTRDRGASKQQVGNCSTSLPCRESAFCS